MSSIPRGFLVVHTDTDQTVDAADVARLEQLGAPLTHVRNREEFLEVAGGAIAILNSGFRLTAELIEELDSCRVISRYGSGVDNIDIAAASRKGIPVANVPIFCVEEVANRAFTLLLALSCNLKEQDMRARSGRWGVCGLPYAAQIEGAVLGVIGFGRIGRAMARRAQAFGMQVQAYDPCLTVTSIVEQTNIVDLDRLLATSDYVSLHLPLSSETKRLLDARRLSLLKPSAYLINTARGGVVDESALVEALLQGRIAGAGVDVLDPEPPAVTHPMFELSNVILTPHSAAHTELATRKVRRGAIEAVISVLEGRRPDHIVNSAALGLL